MDKVEEWLKTFHNNVRIIRNKLRIYYNELAQYDEMSPVDKVKHKDRVIELRELIKFYEDILEYYDNEDKKIDDEVIGDILITPKVQKTELIETEFGDFEVVFSKSKEELIDEYYEVMQNLSHLNRVDKSNAKTYKELSEKYYFRFALLIERAPDLRKGDVQNQILNAGTEDDYQMHINQYHSLKRIAQNIDVKREELISELHLLEEQLSNFTSNNSIDKNELRVKIADLKSKIAGYTGEKNKYDMLCEIALIKSQTVKGKIKDDYCAYLISKLDADDRVNREISNTEVFKYELEKNDAELRLLALSDNPDEEQRERLLKKGSNLEQMRDIAFSDLSKARKDRLKREILHAYNVGSISKEDRDTKLSQLESYVVINEAVENEVSLYALGTTSEPGTMKR